MNPTLRQLAYLVHLHDHRSFSRAAAHAHVAQPTLSAGIAELEQILGQTLIDRSQRGAGVAFTPMGLEVLSRARTILTACDDLVQQARQSRDPLSGPVRLGAIPTIAPFYLAGVLSRTRRTAPQLQLLLREDQTHRLSDALRRGELDAAILALPTDLDGLHHRVLQRDPLLLICPASHAWAGRSHVTSADLGHAELLFLEDGHCLRDHALAACAAHQARGALQAASLYTLAHLVAAGHGLALVPDMAVQHGLTHGLDLVAIPFAAPVPHRDIALVWRAGSPASRDAMALADVLVKPER